MYKWGLYDGVHFKQDSERKDPPLQKQFLGPEHQKLPSEKGQSGPARGNAVQVMYGTSYFQAATFKKKK